VRRFAFSVLLCVAGCASIGPVNDGTSLAFGTTSQGMLIHGRRLPASGDGWMIPPLWSNRGNNFGTDELVGLIVRAARRVRQDSPGGPPLYVADLSPQLGGRSIWHRSHQTGRDADLMFFLLDTNDKPQPVPWGMWLLDDDGKTRKVDKHGNALAQPRLHLDVDREWLLVRALLSDPAVDVQYLFISEGLKKLLLDHAEEIHEPTDLIERARAVLHQPVGSLPHDDHLHLRIYCPASDRALGCRDVGPLRWFKKSWKYLQARHLDVVPFPEAARATIDRPFCELLGGDVRVAGI
jgi:penicillin-insensitive murein endopeptidase